MRTATDIPPVGLDEIARWQQDPIYFIETILGCELWGAQREVAESVRDHKETVVASCHESGKTFLAARLAIWWFVSFSESMVITTGPSDEHVRRMLWGEIRSAFAQLRERYGDLDIGEPTLKHWQMPGHPRWFITGFATKPDTAQQHAARFTGFHAPHILVIFDEASAVHRLIWDAADGIKSSAHVRHLAIGNPADPTGPFYDAYTDPTWSSIRIDAYDCPNVKARRQVLSWGATWEWVQSMRRKYGPDYENDPVYQFKVRGLFPTSGIETLIGIADLERAFERSPPPINDAPISMGVDVARFGDDLTTFCILQGPEILDLKAMSKRDGMEVAGRTIELCNEFGIEKRHAHRVSIDDTGGYGAGPVDRLRELGWRVSAENFGEKPKVEEDEYLNRRTELWMQLRDWLVGEACLASCPAVVRQELKADLPSVKYQFRSDGRRALEPKADIKKRIGRSPDHADALALALAFRSSRPVSLPPVKRREPVDAPRDPRPGLVPPEGKPRRGRRRRPSDQSVDEYVQQRMREGW